MPAKTSALNAAGTTLSYKLVGASTFTAVAQLVDFEEDGIATDDIETTLLNATIKTYIPSIPDPGGLTLTIYNVPADPGVIALKGMANAPSVVQWQIMYPDGSSPTTGTTETFSGYVNNFSEKGFAIGETPTADVGIKISGLITTTTGS
jgi:hypothetical protein